MECDWYDVACHASWLQEELRLLSVWVLEGVLNGTVSLVSAIPVPAWASGIGNIGSSIPASVAYFAGAFRLGFGAGIISGAYILRFLIRRIPVIG